MKPNKQNCCRLTHTICTLCTLHTGSSFYHFVNMITFIGTFIYNIKAEMTFSYIQLHSSPNHVDCTKFKSLFFLLCLSHRFSAPITLLHHTIHLESFTWPFLKCIHLPFVVHNKLGILIIVLNCRWIMAFGKLKVMRSFYFQCGERTNVNRQMNISKREQEYKEKLF